MNDKNGQDGGAQGLGSDTQGTPKFEGFGFTDPASRVHLQPVDKPKSQALSRLKAILLYIALAVGALVVGMLLANYIVMPLLVGGEEIEVPDLTNMSFEAATALLVEMGLNYEKVAEEYSPDVPAGYVVSQHQEPGMKVRPGRIIELTVSAGSEEVRVPNVTKMSQRQAEDVLRRAGLVVGKVRESYDPNVPESSVIGQNPEPGREVPRGTRVDLLVSLGSEETTFKMPNLVGADYRTAVSRVSTWELVMGDTTFEHSTTVPPGHIIRQDPEVGGTVSRGDTVGVVISKGPPTGGEAVPPEEGETPPPPDTF
jgi:beta-lactam-binding protein with PASTA domain